MRFKDPQVIPNTNYVWLETNWWDLLEKNECSHETKLKEFRQKIIFLTNDVWAKTNWRDISVINNECTHETKFKEIPRQDNLCSSGFGWATNEYKILSPDILGYETFTIESGLWRTKKFSIKYFYQS